jgi:hypothetical protein
MGLFFSSESAAAPEFVDVPETEFTPCAIMLKKMGYRLVVLGFEEVVLQQADPALAEFRAGQSWVVSRYNDAERLRLIRRVSESVNQDVSNLIVSLLAQGLVVTFITSETSQQNGTCIHDSSSERSGYQFQGVTLLKRVMQEHLGLEVAPYVRLEEGPRPWILIKQLLKEYRLKPEEVLVVHQNPSIIRKARERHLGGILVSDHQLGLRF